jgi:Arc/MetJ-type ribon-helix-helix transcriptional regulator
MPLSVTLDSHGEELVSAHLRSGRYRSPEEVITRALETLSEKEPPTTSGKRPPRKPLQIFANCEKVLLSVA